jgi:hypothetical protein
VPRSVPGSVYPPMLRDCDSLPAFADLDLSAVFGFASGLSALFRQSRESSGPDKGVARFRCDIPFIDCASSCVPTESQLNRNKG